MDDRTELIAIKNSLEAVRDALTESKYALKHMLDRIDKAECDLEAHQKIIAEMAKSSTRVDLQLNAIQKNQDTIGSDMRSVRNTVVGAVLVAIVLGIGGLAFNSVIQNNRVMPVAPAHTNEIRGK